MMTTQSDEVQEQGSAVEVPAGMSPAVADQVWRQAVAGQVVERARAGGMKLSGPGGVLTGLTKTVLETALEAEMSDHLGFEKGDPAARGAGNQRNGHSEKTVQTELGPVRVRVPRDREATFEPLAVPKHSRRAEGFDDLIISLYAKGLTTGEIQAHLADSYGAEVSRDLISRVTDAVLEEMAAWRNRPLDKVYPVVFIDAIYVKVRDGAVANRPVYVAVGVSLDGDREVLGMWVGTGGEGAKQWLAYLAELKNRGVQDVFIVCADGLKGIAEAIEATWPAAVHQTCVVHMVRATLRYSARKDWQAITPALRAIYTAPTIEDAEARLDELAERWQAKYPAIISLWRANWGKFIPFLAFDAEIRTVIYTTNMIESLNARYRQATRRRGHFPSEQAALKVLYLVTREKSSKGGNITGRIPGWKKALNAFAITYGDRIEI